MEKKEIQEKLKTQLAGAASSIKNVAQNVKKPEIKIPNQVKGIFKKNGSSSDKEEQSNGQETDEAIMVEKSVADAEEKEKKATADESNKQEQKEVEPTIKAISTRNAIKIFYYLMAVDGEVYHSEEDKFDEIGAEIDPSFAEHKDSIVLECKAQLDKVIDADDYYDVVQDGVEEAILIPDTTADSFITPKLLIWDLLTIAYSDEQYDEKERKLIKYIVRKFNIDSTIFLEMENTLLTLIDLEKETKWIKTTNRPYLTIEAHVNELQDRRNCIFESVKDLIRL